MASDKEVAEARARLRAGKGPKRGGKRKKKSGGHSQSGSSGAARATKQASATSCGSIAASILAAVAVIAGVIYYRVILWPIAFRPVDLSGKTFVVIGASAGIGLETAVVLASWNATVVGTARTAKKASRVEAELRARVTAEAPESTGRLSLVPLDLSDFEQVDRVSCGVWCGVWWG